MPVCFQLIDRCTGQPAVLQQVDSHICQALDLPWSQTKWVNGWYDFIGFLLACGKSFPQVTDLCHDDPYSSGDHWLTMRRINHFLMERYESSAWWEPKH